MNKNDKVSPPAGPFPPGMYALMVAQCSIGNKSGGWTGLARALAAVSVLALVHECFQESHDPSSIEPTLKRRLDLLRKRVESWFREYFESRGVMFSPEGKPMMPTGPCPASPPDGTFHTEVSDEYVEALRALENQPKLVASLDNLDVCLSLEVHVHRASTLWEPGYRTGNGFISVQSAGPQGQDVLFFPLLVAIEGHSRTILLQGNPAYLLGQPVRLQTKDNQVLRAAVEAQLDKQMPQWRKLLGEG